MNLQRLRNISLNSDDILNELNKGEDYSVLYHFSPMRQNVIEWFDFKRESTLLEIGSECGALTGLYSDKVDRVISVEWNKDMFEIAKIRYSTKDNIEFRFGNVEVINADEKFDYITSIGTMMRDENKYNDDDLIEYLRKIKTHLKDDGVFICAVKNRYGLSSFNSFRKKENTSFSYKQIDEALVNAGFSEVYHYYPMPDFVFAKEIFSEDRLPVEGDCRDTSVDYINDKYVLFSEENTFDEICRKGDFPFFSNSFLILAN